MSQRKTRQLSPCAWASVRCDTPAAEHFTGELAAGSIQQLVPTEGEMAYSGFVAGRAGCHQPSGPYKPRAKSSDRSGIAASSEAATKRMYLGDMSVPLCVMPDGNTSNAQVAANSIPPIGERQNSTPIFVTMVTNTRRFPTCIRSPFRSDL